MTLRPKDGMPVEVRPYRGKLFIQGKTIGQHALLDASPTRLRKRVFVDKLGWPPCEVDEQGREHEPVRHRTTPVTSSCWKGAASWHALGCCRLKEAQPALRCVPPPYRRSGALCCPSPRSVGGRSNGGLSRAFPRRDCRHWCASSCTLRYCRRRQNDVSHSGTVSDPVMERILRRIGAQPRTTLAVVVDKHGFSALALVIDCSEEIAIYLSELAHGRIAYEDHEFAGRPRRSGPSRSTNPFPSIIVLCATSSPERPRGRPARDSAVSTVLPRTKSRIPRIRPVKCSPHCPERHPHSNSQQETSRV